MFKQRKVIKDKPIRLLIENAPLLTALEKVPCLCLNRDMKREGPYPNLFGIPFGKHFSRELVQSLQNKARSPFDLAQTVVFVPTIRGVSILKKIFYQNATNQGLLLPRIIPLNDFRDDFILEADLDESIPPPVNKWQRLGLLTQMVLKIPGYTSPPRALKMAESLADLLDEIELLNLDTSQLETLVSADYAEHWQVTLKFLTIISQQWPEILKEYQVIGPQARTHTLLTNLAKEWQKNPPTHRIVIAGTTGTVPATAHLIKTILSLPRGEVYLSGFSEESLQKKLSLSHPLYTLSCLLKFLNVSPQEVIPLKSTSIQRSDRQQLIYTAMKEDSLDLPSSFSPVDAPSMVTCKDLRTEARVIALIMRQAIETTTGPIVLITAHQNLATWVQQELKRWDLVADRSDGVPLSQTPVGTFVLLVADYLIFPTVSNFLAVLKHPLCGQQNRPKHLKNVRKMEKDVIRRPEFEFHQLQSLTQHEFPDLYNWLEPLLILVKDASLLTGKQNLFDLVNYHFKTCEQLTQAEETYPLWKQEDGLAMKNFYQDLLDKAHYFPALMSTDYPSFLKKLMEKEAKIHDQTGIGSRLQILGVLEARLVDAEVVILGGLNEGSWPPTVTEDFWLSRSMRQSLGLPLPERRLGQSAHYFCGCFYAPYLYLTRSEEEDGVPTLPSRWWQRLEAVHLKNQHLFSNSAAIPWQAWAKALTGEEDIQALPPPLPKPPTKARPKHFSVTDIERWMRDPYGIYAKHCLKLSPLPEISASSAVQQGRLIHKVLDPYIKTYGQENPSVENLLNLAFPFFQKNILSQTFWWQRFQKIAYWFIEQLHKRQGTSFLSEHRLEASITIQNQTFTLRAIADRLDKTQDLIKVVDYKTGSLPSMQDIQQGFSPQLPLEAWLVQQQCFAEPAVAMELWHLTGKEPGGKIVPVNTDLEFLKQTEQGLRRLLTVFMDSNTPYLACPNPDVSPAYNEYAHLERLKEWQGRS